MLPPPVHDPDAVREAADSILAHPRYDEPAKPLVDRLWEWVGDRIASVLGSFVGSGAGTAVAWAIVVAAIALVVYFVVRYGRVTGIAAVRSAAPSAMVELSRRPAEWRAEAEALEAQGRWREGLRCRHRALVGSLVLAGAIRDQAGRTAGEYVRDVARSRPDVAGPMAAATELFEAAWYGGAATGADEARRFADLDRVVLGTRVGAP